MAQTTTNNPVRQEALPLPVALMRQPVAAQSLQTLKATPL